MVNNMKRLREFDAKSHLNEDVMVYGLVQSKALKPMRKKNSNFIIIRLQDRDKVLDITSFDNVEFIEGSIVEGEVYCFGIAVKPYDKGQNGVSCIINQNEDAIDAYSRSQIWTLNTENREDYKNIEPNLEWADEKCLELLEFVKDTPFGSIAIDLYQRHMSEMRVYPAASSYHHTSMGGLYVHSISVANTTLIVGKNYNDIFEKDFINLKLLVSGALLHDIGKIKELDLNRDTGKVEYSNNSVLMSHILSGILMVTESAIRLGIPDIYRDELIHLIASHHGNIEWGSLCEPACIEADLLAMADNMDATAYRRYKAYTDMASNTSKSEWKGNGILKNYKATKMIVPTEI